jgi:VWFA-related protein
LSPHHLPAHNGSLHNVGLQGADFGRGDIMVMLSNARSVIASAVCVGVVAAGVTLVAGQSPQSPQSPAAPPPDTPRLRISTTLVEIDAVVTDRQGRHVTDLKPEDFELMQDGRPQKISSVRYVSTDARGPATGGDDDVRRTVAIVIDSLNMSFTSMAYTRQALLRFVDTQIEPGDRVAVVDADYTGGRWEDFSGDTRALRKKIESLRHNVMSSAQMPFGRMMGNTAFDPREEAFTVGTLGTVNQLVRGMKELPGRKAVVLASDGFPILERDAARPDGLYTLRPRVTQAIKQLADDANRSFVVLHAVDTRRLAPVDIATAMFDGAGGLNLNEGAFSRLADFGADGPALVAQSGGGLYLRNSNDLEGLFTRVMNDQRGYYLLAYEPDDQTFVREKQKRPVFHGVKVKVSRPETRVRARAGFFGVADENLPPAREPARASEPARAFAGS